MVKISLAFGLAVVTVVWSIGYVNGGKTKRPYTWHERQHEPGTSDSSVTDSIKEFVKDEELYEITQMIWKADANRFPKADVKYGASDRTKGKGKGKFFTFVNAKSLKDGTYKLLIDLFDNYDPIIGNEEKCNPACLAKEKAFIDAIYSTGPIQVAYKWLSSKVPALASKEMFKKKLHQFWFERYSRLRRNTVKDSCGFAHTFVGEIDNSNFDLQKRRVMGLHNWVRMYQLEYQGILNNLKTLASCQPPAIETITFDWQYPFNSGHVYNKGNSSLFIRSSPEVEIALSTICLLTRPTLEPTQGGVKIKHVDCPIEIRGKKLVMHTTVKEIRKGELTISTTYPVCK